MYATLLNLGAPTKTGALASADVEVVFDNESRLRIHDIRVLRNQQGDLWIAWPSRVLDGKYIQLLSASRRFTRMIEDCVLPAFEKWQSERTKAAAGSQNTHSAEVR
jgi:DNA-binding cell septation regulator SpoVG